MDANVVKMDLRKVPVHERHPRVLDTWEKLEEEATLQITNDFDPKPLRYQFEGAYKDTYAWDYVSKGTDGWVVNIRKLALPRATGEELRKRLRPRLPRCVRIFRRTAETLSLLKFKRRPAR